VSWGSCLELSDTVGLITQDFPTVKKLPLISKNSLLEQVLDKTWGDTGQLRFNWQMTFKQRQWQFINSLHNSNQRPTLRPKCAMHSIHLHHYTSIFKMQVVNSYATSQVCYWNHQKITTNIDSSSSSCQYLEVWFIMWLAHNELNLAFKWQRKNCNINMQNRISEPFHILLQPSVNVPTSL